MGVADEHRVGVIGQSRGGYAVLALIVQSQIFRAAVCIEPSVVSFPQSAGQMQFGLVYGSGYGEILWLGGNLWTNRKRWIRNSPFFYFDKAKAPTLVLVGGMSGTEQGNAVYAGLSQLGKDVSYVLYDGEGHAPSRWTIAHHLDFLQRVIAWFDKYLKGLEK
jgi:dipeptidyl aminopeptidase/acylaminoacyl peptidase